MHHQVFVPPPSMDAPFSHRLGGLKSGSGGRMGIARHDSGCVGRPVRGRLGDSESKGGLIRMSLR